MKSLFPPIALIFALGCGSDAEPTEPDASTASIDAASSDGAVTGARYYEHVIPECGDDPLVNCSPSIELCGDGVTAHIQVTDIKNTGSYTETVDVIIATFPVADVPGSVTFAKEGESLVDDWLAWSWSRVDEPEFSDCE